MLLIVAVQNNSPLFALFQNNLINWLILVILLSWLWLRLMPSVFAKRKDKIEAALQEAASAAAEGQAILLAQQQRVANSKQEIEALLHEARKIASQISQQMAVQTAKDIESVRHKIEQQIANERQIAVAELRSQAATVAVRLTEAALPGAITDGAKSRLLDQFTEQLEAVRNLK